MRIQKYIADCGVTSRRKAEQMVQEGRVSINGVLAAVGAAVGDDDVVCVDGKRIAPDNARVVIMLNKPAGMICAASDPQGRSTVADLFKDIPHRTYNVGRLDYDSEGLLIMTNDGELANCMMHPSFALKKTYYAICNGVLTDSDARALEQGVDIGGFVTSPAEVRDIYVLKGGDKTSLFITIHEGHNRQVRRMLAAAGHETLLLRRVQVGPLKLGDLKAGQWRYLTDNEISILYGMLELTKES